MYLRLSKNSIKLLVFFFFLSAFVPLTIFAQTATPPTTPPATTPSQNTGTTSSSRSTSCLITEVGNAPGEKPALPPECTAVGGSGGGNNGPLNPDATCPATGPISCGTQAQGCHCSASYQASACSFSGGVCDYCQPPANSAAFAIDITNPLDGPVYLPKISINGEAQTLTCKGYANESGSIEPGQVIQILSCVTDQSNQAIWMQFHHSKKENPIEVGRTYKSGEAIGKSAAFQTFNSGPHVHLQMGVGGPCGFNGTQGCVDPSQFVQC